MRLYYPVLSIAGSDSSGGAGIQADIKAISALGCYAMTAITSITAQNTTGVRSIMPVSPEIVADQIDMVFEDIRPLAVKIGMLCNAGITAAVADRLEHYKPDCLIVDPVMVSTSGSRLLEEEAVRTLVERIFPLATLVTPNLREGEALTGQTNPALQAHTLAQFGAKNVLVKGGDSDDKRCKTDILYLDNTREALELRADAVDTVNTHGTGCTLSSAIASFMALGYDLKGAVRQAKFYVTKALEAGAFVKTGEGHGPINHFFSPRRLKNYNPQTRQQ